MKISIIIPTYKPGNYLETCVQSLIAQTFNKDMFEVIIVLNGDKDPYYEYIKSLVGSLENFKLYYIDQKGVSYARNFGLSVAKGEQIVFLDDDDLLSKNYLEELLKETLAYSSLKYIIQSNFKTLNKGIIGDDYISKAIDNVKGDAFSIVKYRKFMSSVCGKMFSRDLLHNNFFDSNLEISEDAVYLFKLSKSIDVIKIVSNSDCIYYRQIRDDSATTRKRKKSFYIKCFKEKIKAFTSIYLNDFRNLNFVFYITRIMASVKVVSKQILFK